MLSEQIQLFWRSYLAKLPMNHSHQSNVLPNAWSFGHNSQIADRLGKLVVAGIKTATSSRYFGENVLDEAGLSIVLDGSKNPICIIETYEIKIRRYRDIDEEFARAEGEGDLSLDYWQKVHWDFFCREVKKGYEVDEDMLLSCERFRVVDLSLNTQMN